MFDVIVCGSNAVDIFVQTKAEVLDHAHPKEGYTHKVLAYPVGAKVLIQETQNHIGGGGINALASFTKQNHRCGYIGKFGEDEKGHLVFSWLERHKVTFLGQVEGETGFSIVLDSQATDRTILNYRGANNTLSYSPLPEHALHTKWFYGTGMQGKSYVTIKKLFKFMHNHGIKTALNTNGGMVTKGLKSMQNVLGSVDVLILNKDEAQELVHHDHSHELVKALTKFGPTLVAITDGDEGVTVCATSPWVKIDTCFHIAPAPKLTIVETTGAGDAFSSGLVSGLLQKKPVKIAALMGVINAENVIQAKGAQENIPSHTQLAKQLKKAPHKITAL